MEMITVTAKTLDEAITKALIQLGTTSDNLEYTVIEKGSAGFLGFIGKKDVVIQAKKKNIIVPILVEVNIAHEESKFGISEEDAIQLVEEIAELENVRIKGLMTIAPYVENAEDNRLYFRKIKDLSVDIAAKNIDNVSMEILSMGMTGDYEVAIEEGATMVRVGTGIFGARNYNKQ